MKKMFNISRSRMLQALLLVIWGVVCFVFFERCYKYHFFYQEQNQLFLMSWDYVMGYLDKPAWVACLGGDFLTQFYYYLYAGPAILTVALMVMGDLMFRGSPLRLPQSPLRLPQGGENVKWIAFVIAIAMMTIEAYLCMSETHRLSSIIALAGGAGMWWGTEQIIILRRRINAYLKTNQGNESDTYKKRNHITRIVLMTLAAVVTYWMFGIGVWWLLLMMGSSLILQSPLRLPQGGGNKTVQSTSLIVPPLQGRLGGVLERPWRFVYLLISLFTTLIFIKAMTGVYYLNYSDAALYPGIGTWPKFMAETEQQLAYDNEYYLGNYDRVISIYEADGEKTDNKSFFYCMALEQKGMLAEKLPQMKNANLGTFLKIDDQTPLFQIKMINELYYLLGDMTYTERAALLALTFSPEGRNVRMVKRLAEANLVNGDYPAAMKYLRMLSKTIVYKEWAEHMIQFTKDEKVVSPVTAEIMRKRQYINKTDNIRLGDDCYVILTQLLDSNPTNSVALDYLLCSDMLSKQRDVFMRDYEKYGAHARTFFKDIYEAAKNE